MLKLNGADYHFTQQGQGEPLLWLHGFTGSTENWEAHSTLFAQKYAVFTLDLLGHGQTSHPSQPDRYRMEAAAQDLAQFIETVIKAPVHLLGYSMGGRLALYFALHFPQWVKTLVLESASPGLATEAERQARIQHDEALAQRLEQEDITTFVDYWEKIPLFETQRGLPAEVRQRLRQQRLKNNPQGLANSLRGMGTGVQPALWDELPTLAMPVLLLAGALDSKFSAIAHKMHRLMPQARLEIVPEAGHTLHLENPLIFQQQLLKMLP